MASQRQKYWLYCMAGGMAGVILGALTGPMLFGWNIGTPGAALLGLSLGAVIGLGIPGLLQVAGRLRG